MKNRRQFLALTLTATGFAGALLGCGGGGGGSDEPTPTPTPTPTPKPGTTVTAGTQIVAKDYGNGTITVFSFYTFAPAASASQYVLSAAFAGGTLTKAQYDQGAPAIDTGRTTGIDSFVAYPGGRFYNIGGLIAYLQYPGTPGVYQYPASNEAFQHNAAVDAVSPTATVTIT